MTGGAHRLRSAYEALDRHQRLAGVAAVALLFTMFLPWYEKSYFGPKGKLQDTISAFGAVSFVEAAIFLVSAGVIALLLARADKRPFHLPGGDGTVIFAAGVWATLLIFYRVFDQPDVSGTGVTIGIQWGIFLAFVAAAALAVAGQRIRAARSPEPPQRTRRPRPDPATPPEPFPVDPSQARTEVVPLDKAPTQSLPDRDPDPASEPPSRPKRAVTREDAQQLTFDEPD